MRLRRAWDILVRTRRRDHMAKRVRTGLTRSDILDRYIERVKQRRVKFQPFLARKRGNAAPRNDVLWPLKKRMNCLGYMARDRGHRRVPDPPDRITGKIAFMYRPSFVEKHCAGQGVCQTLSCLAQKRLAGFST